MIHLIYGENNYQARQFLNKLLSDFPQKNAIEKYEGESLLPERLPDILRGASLFSLEKMVVIYGASDNKTLWEELAGYCENTPEELLLVLFETQVDKRTKTYKVLREVAQIHENNMLNPAEAGAWLKQQANQRSITLTPKLLELIVNRAGSDQWKLHFTLEKLMNFEEITEDIVRDVIEPQPEANVFDLIDAALRADQTTLTRQLAAAKLSQDPYQFFGLLSGQIFRLITLAVSKKSYNQVASDLKVHPYPLQKMSSIANSLSAKQNKIIVQTLVDCDEKIKRSGAEPWQIIELALLKLAASRASR